MYARLPWLGYDPQAPGRDSRAGFDRHPEQTLNVARTIYSRLPDEVRLWLRSAEFVPIAGQRARLLGALGQEI
jgi:hypothetical protein